MERKMMLNWLAVSIPRN